jgi:hypothetical protein
MSKQFTAHDVRKLRLCAICNGLGHLDRMLTLPGFPVGGLYHGKCAVRMLRRTEVLALPENELRKLTLADAGMDLMRELVNRSKPANVGGNRLAPTQEQR